MRIISRILASLVLSVGLFAAGTVLGNNANWLQNEVLSSPALAITPADCPGTGYYTVVFNRCLNHGYYTDTLNSALGTYVLPAHQLSGVTNVDQFVAIIHDDLFVDASGCIDPLCQERQENLGSSYIVNTMLGHNGDDFGGTRANGIAAARTNFPTWEARVRAYDTAGQVQWSAMVTYTQASNYLVSAAFSNFDDMYSGFGGDDLQETIVFNNPDGSLYEIKKLCGNPRGLSSLATSFSGYSLESQLTLPSASSIYNGAVLQTNTSYTLGIHLLNHGPQANTIPTTLNIAMTASDTSTTPIASNVTPSGQSAKLISVPADYGPTCNPVNQFAAVCGKNHWEWNYTHNPFLSGQSNDETFDFTLPPSTAGSTFCLRAFVTPGTDVGVTVPSTNAYCFSVQAPPSYPSLRTQSSDVHAGGRLCTSASNSLGGVSTNYLSNSYADFVVSSLGLGIDYGTNNSHNGDALKVGASGNFYDVCRTDLFQAAAQYTGSVTSLVSAPPDSVPHPTTGGHAYYRVGGNDYFNVGGASGVFRHTGTLLIDGQVSSSLTIVNQGDVLIVDDIKTVNTLGSRGSLPGLGVIASGSISICGCGNGRQVDAFLYAGNTIDTCYPTIPGNYNAECNDVLRLNGFMMSRAFSLNRIGTGGVGSVPGEILSLNPALYLNPPPLFTAGLSGSPALEGNGEKRPLY